MEEHRNPEEIDHVLITMDVGRGPRLLVSVNTLSKRNREAGFDARLRVGVVREAWTILPPRGIEPMDTFDYAAVEATQNVFYEHTTRLDLEKRLLESAREACLLEAWGAPYLHRGPGLHQIHSRRASCAVPDDIIGNDGALRFYFDQDRGSEMLLFKFCGQP